MLSWLEYWKLLQEIMRVISDEGYKEHPLLSDPYARAFGKEFINTIGFTLLVPENRQGRVDTNLDKKGLDRLTIKCAIALAPISNTSLHGKKELNQIRNHVVTLFMELGYINMSNLCRAHMPSWPSYALWIDLAKVSGLNDGEITEYRQRAHHADPSNYEE